MLGLYPCDSISVSVHYSPDVGSFWASSAFRYLPIAGSREWIQPTLASYLRMTDLLRTMFACLDAILLTVLLLLVLQFLFRQRIPNGNTMLCY